MNVHQIIPKSTFSAIHSSGKIGACMMRDRDEKYSCIVALLHLKLIILQKPIIS
jgi:hypothetical protein